MFSKSAVIFMLHSSNFTSLSSKPTIVYESCNEVELTRSTLVILKISSRAKNFMLKIWGLKSGLYHNWILCIYIIHMNATCNISRVNGIQITGAEFNKGATKDELVSDRLDSYNLLILLPPDTLRINKYLPTNCMKKALK